MRGPGYKLSGDVRRTWRCPSCGRERKLLGEITSLACICADNPWMQIVAERTIEPRPLQRPSDVERRPIDFGIEPPPRAPEKPEATIIKSAISKEPEITPPPVDTLVVENPVVTAPADQAPPADFAKENAEEEWGEGIL